MTDGGSQGDLDAEFTLVRVALEHPQKVTRVMDLVESGQFTDPVCRRIWKVVRKLGESGRPRGLDEVVKELDPADLLGPNGCLDAATVEDCVRQTISYGSGTAEEAKWCALRIRADTHRRALLDVIEKCRLAVIGPSTKEIKALMAAASTIADALRAEDLAAARELKRLNRRPTTR